MPESGAAPSPASPEPSAEGASDAPRLGEPFVRAWLHCLERSPGYAVNYPFARVRTLSGKTHEVCVPLLSYAHLDAAQASHLAATRPRRHVRHLAPLDAAAPHATPVISAVPLHPWTDSELFWEGGLSSNLRKKIRRAAKDGITAEVHRDREAADAFHTLFSATMARHGSPALPCAFFREVLEVVESEIHLVRRGSSILAAYVVLFDPDVALFSWAGFDPRIDPGYASLVGEWSAVQSAFRRRCRWFDLGRAPLGGAAWQHKQYWRPTVFHATRTPPPERSIYQKFAVASRLWRCLPTRLATGLAPWIIRRLPDA